MSKASKACDISPAVRKEVMERDGGACIVCGSMQGVQIAHYIPRSRLGLGMPQNLGCLCLKCHGEYDNGKLREEIGNVFKGYLWAHYKGWKPEDLVYKKGRG